jgi:7-cyano-7-deazaguanine reductase
MDMSELGEELRKRIHPIETVDRSVLEVLDYTYGQKRDISVCIDQPEFTSLCPLSALPDFGRITIRYTPAEKIVELKSLKYYLLQYRNVGVFYEHVVNRILDDLVAVLAPHFMEVVGAFTPRGGITTTVTVKHGTERD